jgi:hypothetical protein
MQAASGIRNPEYSLVENQVVSRLIARASAEFLGVMYRAKVLLSGILLDEST